MDKPDIGDELTIFFCKDGNANDLGNTIIHKNYCTARGCVSEVRKLAKCIRVDLKVIDVGAEGE